MKSGRSLVSLAMELERQLETKKDLLVPSSLTRYQTEDSSDGTLHVEEKSGPASYKLTELARRHLADRLKIPYIYFERMRAEQPELLDHNVNTWLQSDDETRMLRTLDGKVRAILSKRYRRLDNFELAQHVLPVLQRLPEARFESVELTSTRMYLKVVTPRVTYEIAPGDVVQAGVVVSNSEVGQGTLTVQPLIFRLLCRNGLIAADSSLRKTHVGRMLESSHDSSVVFKDDTLLADDKALFLKVRDVVEAAVSEVTFFEIAERMQRTLGIKINGNPAKAVEVLANRYALNENECIGILSRFGRDEKLTGYDLVNAVTSYSQVVPEYDRATELEALGGKLIQMPAREWKELSEAE